MGGILFSSPTFLETFYHFERLIQLFNKEAVVEIRKNKIILNIFIRVSIERANFFFYPI